MRKNLCLRLPWYPLLVASFVAIILEGCAPQATPITTACVTNSDQSALFTGHWSTHPIPLAVEATDFSDAELTAIKASIDTWNTFYQASKGFQLYLSGTSNLAVVSSGGARLTYATACSTSAVGANGFTDKIMIYKNASNWTYGSSIMALTSTCPIVTANSTYKKFVQGVMEINFQNYFASGKPIPDLQSIVTHELGHMIGLNHSCTGSGCTSAPDDYTTAIMYPSLGFDGVYGRVKRSLNSNDQERANCLY